MDLPCSWYIIAVLLPCFCHALAVCAMLLPRLGSNYAVSAKNLPLRAPCGAQQTCDAEPCDAARARRTTQSPARHQWQDAPNNYYFGPHCGDATHTHHQQHKHTHTHTTNTRNKHTHTHTHTRTHTRTCEQDHGTSTSRTWQYHGKIMARTWQEHTWQEHGNTIWKEHGKIMARTWQ
jgi:hypothetical protein